MKFVKQKNFLILLVRLDNFGCVSYLNIHVTIRDNKIKEYRNDPIKGPAFFKRPPRISAQVISSMLNKRPLRLRAHPIKGGAFNRGLPYLKILLSYKKTRLFSIVHK